MRLELEPMPSTSRADETRNSFREMSTGNNTSQDDWMVDQIKQLKALVNIVNEKLDKILEVQVSKSNTINQVLVTGVNNEVSEPIEAEKESQQRLSPQKKPAQELLQKKSLPTPRQEQELQQRPLSPLLPPPVSKQPLSSLEPQPSSSKQLGVNSDIESNKDTQETYNSSQISNEDCVSIWTPSEVSTEVVSVYNEKLKSVPKVDWHYACQKLLNTLWDYESSKPFRVPVDEEIFEDYRKKITTPMDLSTVREQLDTSCYNSPLEFSKDMDLIFANSKKYTPNKKTRIYKLTMKTEKKYKKLMDPIITSWKSKKNSPLKRKEIQSIDIEDDDLEDEESLETPVASKRKRSKILDKEDSEVSESGSEKSEKKSSNRRRLRSRKNKNIKLVDSESSDESSENSISSESSSESEEIEDESESNFSDEDASLLQKKKKQKEIAASIPLSATDYLNSFRPSQSDSVTITGKVIEVFKKKKKFVQWKQDYTNLLKFIIANNDGVKVMCLAWGEEASQYEGKIKKNRIICMEKVSPTKPTIYNEGDVDYEITIRNYSKLTNKVTEKRL